MNTRRLFDEDPGLLTFSAAVISCEKEKNMYKAVLDETAFFPEEGGQTCDKGRLGGQEVVRVTEKDHIIYHYIKEPIIPGSTVNGSIDWEKRFSDMQQHTGEHIVSGLMHSRFGFDNVGFHLGSVYVTMDFNGTITEEELSEIELEANRAVVSNLPVCVTWPDDKTLSALAYRSKKELEGPVRIVEIPGIDVCACCAPHVRMTGEIGIIKLVRMESYKGGIRVYMLCGFRALADYDEKLKAVYSISEALSLKPEKTADGVKKLKSEQTSLKEQVNILKWEFIMHDINRLSVEKTGKAGTVCLFSSCLDKANISRAWKTLTGMFDCLCVCFAGDDESGYQFLIGGENADAREAGEGMIKALGGRGGGSNELFQGRVPAKKDDLEKYFQTVSDK